MLELDYFKRQLSNQFSNIALLSVNIHFFVLFF